MSTTDKASIEEDIAKAKAKRPRLLVPLEFDHSELKATPWVAYGFGLRGAVTILTAAGGTGKTQLTLQAAVAFALGETFVGFRPMRKGLKIAFVSGEESIDEVERRLAAIEISRVGYKAADIDALKESLKGKLFIWQDKNIALVTKSNNRGAVVHTTLFHGQLIEELKELGVDMVVLDPLIRMHAGLDENSAEMQELHNAAHEIATRCNCAVVLVSHTNKVSRGSVEDQNAARGTSAMVDAARVVLVMANVTPSEAKEILPESEQHRCANYCRLGDPKQSYAGNSAVRYFKKRSVKLPVLLEDNTDDYRFVLDVWKPDGNGILAQPWLQQFLDKLKAGPSQGELFTTATDGRRGNRADALLEQFGVPKRLVRSHLNVLVSAGHLKTEERYSPKGKKNVIAYVVVDRPTGGDFGRP